MLDVVVGLEDAERPKPEPDRFSKVLGCLECLLEDSGGIHIYDDDCGCGMQRHRDDDRNFNGALTEAGAWHVMDDLGSLRFLWNDRRSL